MSAASRKANAALVIDVGGTHVKVLATEQREERKILSGSSMTASKMVRDIKRVAKNWEYGLVSIGFPGPVIHGCPPPRALQSGQRLGAAMQAHGSYQGGRMLFLGLGTGPGSAMIVDGILEPMELAHLPYKNGKTHED